MPQTAQQQTQPLDPDTAYAVVHQRVYAPVFFEKLARDYGIRFRNPQEQMEALSMAAQLRLAHDAEQEKQAQAGTSMLAMARDHLNQVLGGQFGSTPNGDDVVIKEAAAQASFDPELANAILSLQVAARGQN